MEHYTHKRWGHGHCFVYQSAIPEHGQQGGTGQATGELLQVSIGQPLALRDQRDPAGGRMTFPMHTAHNARGEPLKQAHQSGLQANTNTHTHAHIQHQRYHQDTHSHGNRFVILLFFFLRQLCVWLLCCRCEESQQSPERQDINQRSVTAGGWKGACSVPVWVREGLLASDHDWRGGRRTQCCWRGRSAPSVLGFLVPPAQVCIRYSP